MKNRLAVCSWSLKQSVPVTARVMDVLGLDVQAAILDACLPGGEQYLAEVEKYWRGRIVATMFESPIADYISPAAAKATCGVVPDNAWEEVRELFTKAVQITADLGVSRISFHAGALEVGNDVHLGRLRIFCDIAAEHKIRVLLEIGQEEPSDIAKIIEEVGRDNLAVNLDLANLRLYGTANCSTFDALETLLPFTEGYHAKDAELGAEPGVKWGNEVPWGTGQIGAQQVFNYLMDNDYNGYIAIEREMAEDPYQTLLDVTRAANWLKRAAINRLLEDPLSR